MAAAAAARIRAAQHRASMKAHHAHSSSGKHGSSSHEKDALIDYDLKDYEGEEDRHPPPMARAYGQFLDFPLIDNEDNLKGALKKYDALYWIISDGGRYPGAEFSFAIRASRFVQKPFPPGRITRDKILEVGCVDWCVAHAFGEGGDLIGKYTGTINNQILVSALLMSVTAPLYISPPSFDSTLFSLTYSALLGLATFIQLFNLVAFTAVANLINQPYIPSLTMMARVESEFYMSILNPLVYTGVFLFMASLLFVAYVGNVIDLYILCSVLPLIGLLIYILVKTGAVSGELRRETVFQFYEKYCEPNGKLLPVYLDMVYNDYEQLA